MTALPAGAPAPDLADARAELTARLNAIITVLAGRNDVLLKMAWDAPLGTPPGWWDPATAEITVNGDATLSDVHPDDVDPVTRLGRLRHPVPVGVAAHEAAHARVTRWRDDVPDGTPPIVLHAAALLEEPRAEGRQVRFRPGDRLYLRAAARHLITAPAARDGAGPHQAQWQAAAAFTLLCGRALAGVLEDDDVAAVARGAADVLGERAVRKLDLILREAVDLPDGDTGALLDTAQRWLRAAGLPETGEPPCPSAAPRCGTGTAPGTGDNGGDPPLRPADESTGSDGTDPLAASVEAACASVAASAKAAAAEEGAAEDESDRAAADSSSAVVAAGSAEAASRASAASAASTVFGGAAHGRGGGRLRSPVTGSRAPTDAERAAASQLAAALRRARYRGRAVTRIASAIPPGRLNGRDALLAHAQRELGTPVTARPFRAQRRRQVEQPPLAVGIAVDVSGSMRWAAEPMASAAWIIGRGAARIHGRTATVAFGNRVTPVVSPGAPPRDVPVLAADDGEESFTLAIDALDGALGLSTGRGARLLVIVSDGILVVPGEEADGQKAISRLGRAGVGVLWLDHDGRARVMDGAIRVPLPSPADTAAVIARAAEAALSAA
jgi:hypothetical protein